MQSPRERLTAVLVDLESHLGETLTLSSMAHRFGTSPFHFHRLFRQTLGLTPRQHVERLRLERAFIRLTLTDDDVRVVGRTVGFTHHETFTRSFKRYFGNAPSELRRYMQMRQARHLQTEKSATDHRCRLSAVRFETLAPAYLLAKRRMGNYADLQCSPFAVTDRLWNPVARWAERHRVSHTKVGWGLTYDFPELTPPQAQRFDACIRIERAVPPSREIQCLSFAGGSYAMIEHIGSAASLQSAYRRLVSTLHMQGHRYAWREGPSLTMYRHARTESGAGFECTTVCLPVTAARQRKKRQSVRSRAS